MNTTIIQQKIDKNNIKDIWNKINEELLDNNDLEILIIKKKSNNNKNFIEFIKKNPIMVDLDPILYQNEMRNDR